MSYLVIENFKLGLDTRKSWLSAPAGSLVKLENCHITSGGEIQKRKAFVPFPDLPAGTYGLQAVSGGLVVFGSQDLASQFPITLGTTEINYVRCIHPLQAEGWSTDDNGVGMRAVLCSEQFGGLAWCACRFADGLVFAYYNGTLIDQFRSGRVLTSESPDDIAVEVRAALAAAVTQVTASKTNGIPVVSITAGEEDTFDLTATEDSDAGTLTAALVQEPAEATNAVAPTTIVKLLSAVGSASVTSITAPASPSARQELISGAVTFGSTLLKMMQDLADAINDNTETTKYSAVASTVNGIATLTITGDPVLGDDVNGNPLGLVQFTTTGTITFTADADPNPFAVPVNRSQLNTVKRATKPIIVVSPAVKVSASGGTKPYTYAWTVTGDVVSKAPGSKENKFLSSVVMQLDTEIVASAYCTVTDGDGRVSRTSNVAISLKLIKK